MHKQALIAVKYMALIGLMVLGSGAAAFDKSHMNFTNLLSKTVHWNDQGTSTSVNYQKLASLQPAFSNYLKSLSRVSPELFASWPQSDRLAFLINAYNAFTLQLILNNYPLDSIKDTGSLWQSPWENKFFTLLGEKMTLDYLEHKLIRNWSVYGEPRIHFAVNCASVGCPALRPEAYTGLGLEDQLEDQTHRFLADKTRNSLNEATLAVSPIFKWYWEDFEKPWRGTASLHGFLARYSQALGLNDIQHFALNNGEMKLSYTDYDWRLNGR